MSRVFYEFATSSGTSWTHKVVCDLCGAFVEREGELNAEGAPGPRFKHGALDGWANYSQRVKPNDPELAQLSQDLWPHLDRDLCPKCAGPVNDWMNQMGIQIATEETRYLDPQGRKIGGRPVFGVVLCGARFGDAVCLLLAKHDGVHAAPFATGLDICPVCMDNHVRAVTADAGDPRLDGQLRSLGTELRAFTPEQLQVHAVEQHNVFYEDDAGRLRAPGWVTSLEHPRVAYADVATALRAELKLLRSR